MQDTQSSTKNVKIKKHTQTLVETRANIRLMNFFERITYPAAHNLLKGFPMYTFYVDNESVTKMIKKGLLPTMRHVTRAHRVALDWLFDRINFDPKIQSRYVDTKNQLADILTKGSFLKDEWNNLLRLLKIMNVSHFLAAILAILFQISSKIRNPCRREDRSKMLVKVRQWRNRSQWVLCKKEPEFRWLKYRVRQVFGTQEMTLTHPCTTLKVRGEQWQRKQVFPKASGDGLAMVEI